jgi:2-polyprenyl-3-methyl-5-hydroxy-6-metoxy-1,4-benzoquinol methylase
METAFEQPDGKVKWKNYQDLPGIPGDRKIKDRQKFIQEDFKGASVLDIGCWAGQMMLEAKRLGAKKVLGIEIDKDAINIGRSLGLDIILDDLENPFMWKELPRFDVILCLAILGNMKNKVAVLSNASQLADTMYVEGHGIQHKFSRTDWMTLFLTNTTYKTIEYLGEVTTRPLFRLAREEKTIEYIKNKGYKRIAIIGKAGVGKTYHTKFFKDYKIYSDTKDTHIDGEMFLVDNHGALTLSDYDCVINIVSKKETRFDRIIEREKTTNIGRVKEVCDIPTPRFIAGQYDFYTITN